MLQRAHGEQEMGRARQAAQDKLQAAVDERAKQRRHPQ